MLTYLNRSTRYTQKCYKLMQELFIDHLRYGLVYMVQIYNKTTVWALQCMWRYEEGGEYPRMILDVLQ